ncbi:MAG: hypothetical protein K0S36_1536 [Nitrosospira multiformis]|jgi:hypothetical protein|nr:hypothetical protein [Nitrosospira multiformis]
MKNLIVVLLSMWVLSSCVITGKMSGVREGMTKEQVISIAGNPDGYQRSGDYEALLYIDRRHSWSLFGGPYRDAVDYSVILRDDQVMEFGPGRTHERQAEVPFVRVPGR